MELLSFREFLAEEIKTVEMKSFGNEGVKFPVSVGDKSLQQAISNLPEDDTTGRQMGFRTTWDPKSKKFYTWHARESVHDSVNRQFKFKLMDTVNYLVSVKSKKFDPLTVDGFRPSAESRFFRGLKMGVIHD